MKKINPGIIITFLVVLLISFQGCATQPLTFKIENSLPQSKLAYYNDSFDKLREDLWEKAGYIGDQDKLANFELADMRIENGKLRVDTKTGSFSKGGLASKYTLMGDFDVQVDCHIDFLDGPHDMDQVLHFLAYEKAKEIQELEGVILGLARIGHRDFNMIFSGQIKKGVYHRGGWHKIGSFHGTLRMVRIGNKISTVYKNQGSTKWKKINTFQSTTNEVIVGFRLHNFRGNRTSITARSSVSAEFDNFIINAAQGIEEEEI